MNFISLTRKRNAGNILTILCSLLSIKNVSGQAGYYIPPDGDANATRDNYPEFPDRPKPCAGLKSIIEYQGPICIPTKDGFEPESVANCEEKLKSQCPEFNRPSCEWFPYTWNGTHNDYQCNANNLQFPACKLKYKANTGGFTSKTWMEIFYVNQFGTTNSTKSVYSIVELHRNRLHGFDGLDQAQWPLSVSNDGGVMGVDWQPEETFDKYYQIRRDIPKINEPLCPNAKDVKNLCSNNMKTLFLDYLNWNRKENLTRPSDILASCVWTILEKNGFKQGVCQLSQITTVYKIKYATRVLQIRFEKKDNQILWARFYNRVISNDTRSPIERANGN